MNLNESQCKAVEHGKGPCLVLAGPGSGKTAVLTYRIKRLIDTGVKPEKICVITYTKAAALEMMERFNRLAGNNYPVTFATFHSLFWSILSKEYKLNFSNIVSGNRRSNILNEAMKLSDLQEDSELISNYSNEISFIKNSNIDIEEYVGRELTTENVKAVYKNYEKLKSKYKLYDFDDMLICTYKLLCSNEEVLKYYQMRYEYFLVDEMQDMNNIQYEILCLLCKSKNIFCVGDDDQSIYGFRGANPEIMLNFEERFKDTKRILLDNNYRCPAEIVRASIDLINNNEKRYFKEIKSANKRGSISILHYSNVLEEANAISDKILALKEEKIPLNNIAILYRNHANARCLLEELIKKNIPFYLKDSMPNFYSHFIMQDMEDYFQIAINNVTRQRILNVMNKPNRYISRQALEQGVSFRDIKAFYEIDSRMSLRVEEFFRDIELLSKMTPFAAANYIRKAMGYEKFLIELAIKNGKDKDEYLEILDAFTDLIRDSKNLRAAIEKLQLMRFEIEYNNKNKKHDRVGKVGLYTLHSSKGLEFNKVFILGVNEGVIPFKRATSQDLIESERRLFYVGITRTRESLYISYLDEKNRDRLYPSRFISELCLEDYSSKASS